ncbi:peroxisomal fatty acid beta-oxidation multifunctional protein-like [Phalaenopsis equestris]|uniref:peroxisomal fatty acid beta-oxidation multifunctional protein-like n=1 Tax=Phalaenopsis equestris TaxID=78828 RepID=UPI0009E38A6A|nr:peroxisomal fatty acid beta-oxidation multifunctional protein-like [Phalaenopsis equestris]
MASSRVLIDVGSDGVAVITMSNPPVNALTPSIIAELKEKYAEAMTILKNFMKGLKFNIRAALRLLRLWGLKKMVELAQMVEYKNKMKKTKKSGTQVDSTRVIPTDVAFLLSGVALYLMLVLPFGTFKVIPTDVPLNAREMTQRYFASLACNVFRFVSWKLIVGTTNLYKLNSSRLQFFRDNGQFSGGFDINVFAEVQKTGDVSVLSDVSVDLVVNTIEDAKKPSVAAIQGLALGGGLELTMGCHARISTLDAQLGLPELSLGVIPGSGGTQRLPRLVGLSKAMEMMLLSKSIRAKEGKELGLIDAGASPKELLMVARQWAVEIAERRKPWLRSLQRTDKLGSLSEACQIVHATRQQAKKSAPHIPQRQVCLDAIEEGILFGGYAGVLKEARLFKEIVLSRSAKSLVQIFLAERTTSKSLAGSSSPETSWSRM